MPRLVRALVLAIAVAALVMLASAGPGARFGIWPWGAGLSLLKWATWTGIAAVVASLLLLVVPVTRRGGAAQLVAALAIAIVAVTPPLLFMARGKSVPPIHDITTDTADAPPFVALRAARESSPNGAAYAGGEVAAQQRAHYAELAPIVIAAPPAEVLSRAEALAREMGWEVAASDAATGRLEATATTRWFGFKDDVVVRVRADPKGSRVDVRSASRVGRSDVGANAARIKEFLARLA